MLRPRPVRPLEMSMVVSQPGMMGQVVGSEAKAEGVDERLRPKTEKHVCSFHLTKLTIQF